MNKKTRYYILGITGILILFSLPLIYGTKAAPDSATIYISEGWNIISSPFEEPLSLSEIAKQCELITYKGEIWAWTYDPISGWIQPTQVRKNEGVYILSTEDCTIKLTGTPATFSSRALKRGWNLISAEKSFEEIKGDCQIPSGYKIWALNPTTQNWTNPALTDKLGQSKGYWIAVESSCTLTAEESVEVTYPNGEEFWTGGVTYNITWNCTNLDDVWIALYKGTSKVKTITGSTDADCPSGSYRWQVPEDISSETDYRIMVADQDVGVNVTDWSDNYFTIALGFSQDVELIREVFNLVDRLKSEDDSKAWIYLGNVNDFDERISVGIPSMLDPENPSSYILPTYVTNAIENKKDEIRIIYLDSGLGNPYREKVDEVAQVVKAAIEDAFPGLALTVTTDILPWEKGMLWLEGGIGNVESEEKFIEGERFEFATYKKYLLLVEDPKIQSPEFAGVGRLFSNYAAVGVPQRADYPEDFFYRTAVHEVGHAYGLIHSWASEDAMSYDFLMGKKDFVPTPFFNTRSKMIAENIYNGEFVTTLVKNPNLPPEYPGVPETSLRSARLTPEQTAKSDLEEHLMKYLSDVSPSITEIDDLKMEATLGEEYDEVVFYKNYPGMGKVILGRMEIEEFITDMEIY